MSYTKPGLPNFCNIGNSSDRNNWNQNKNKDNRNKAKQQNESQRRSNEDNKRKNTNLSNEEKGILYDRDYYRKLYGGSLPGENPSNPLNNSNNRLAKFYFYLGIEMHQRSLLGQCQHFAKI